jgi:hypothetical protein
MIDSEIKNDLKFTSAHNTLVKNTSMLKFYQNTCNTALINEKLNIRNILDKLLLK